VPVLVGAAGVHQRDDDPARTVEPARLMADAVRAAAADAGTDAILDGVGLVAVPEGIWSYPDPGAVVAAWAGINASSTPPCTALARIGVLQQTVMTSALEAVADGSVETAVVVGGEAKHRSLRATISGWEGPLETPTTGTPDAVWAPDDDIVLRIEIERHLVAPTNEYALMEGALRHAEGLSVADHARRLAELWAAFSRVATTNPDAWLRDPVTADDLMTPTARNPMVSTPYTKRHCSQWNVDQAAALIVTTVERARALGIPEDRWVHPWAAVESNAMIPLPRRAELHRSPQVQVGAARLSERIGRDVATVDHVDLYSCFPVAVQIQAREIGLPVDSATPPTLTGGMTFAGGPLNNYSLQATVALVRALRADPGSTGLVTSVSGMLTKHGMAVWSTAPPPPSTGGGFVTDDVSAETVAATATLAVVDDHRGAATIDGSTVVHFDGSPWTAVVIATTPDGSRTVANSTDPDVLAGLATEDWTGREITVDGATFTA
jgi:acetyl-CoA C-acetyltransferase